MSKSPANSDLSGLRIDRTQERAPRRRFGWWIAGAALLALLVLVTFFITRPGFVGADLKVTTAVATTGRAPSTSARLTASGYVVAQRQAAVSSKATGRLVYLGVEEGDEVKKGTVLGRIESDDVEAILAEAEANLEATRAAREAAAARLKERRLNFTRVEDLLTRKLVSQAEFDNAEATLRVAEAELGSAEALIGAMAAAVRAASVAVENTRIRAPFDGTVLTKNADVGEMVAPFGSAQSARGAVVTMADMTSLEVEADVSESNIQRVVAGAPAEIVLDAYPDDRYQARVKKIVPTADRAKATVLTKVAFLNIDARVLPEMSAKVMFLETETAAAIGAAELTIPRSAIQRADGETFVFVIEGGRARRQTVEPGAGHGSAQVILNGLNAGDRVITDPPADLKPAARVVFD